MATDYQFPVDTVEFEFEPYLSPDIVSSDEEEETAGKQGVCRFFLRGSCLKGKNCPYRHTKSKDKHEVCKHWLRGLCKKGDHCEFLHKYDLAKMPVCWFFANHGVCNSEDCVFLHIKPENQAQQECPYYTRGFCRLGLNCRKKHVKREVCLMYLDGFCPKGPECEFGHPKPFTDNPKEGGGDHADAHRGRRREGGMPDSSMGRFPGMMPPGFPAGGMPPFFGFPGMMPQGMMMPGMGMRGMPGMMPPGGWRQRR